MEHVSARHENAKWCSFSKKGQKHESRMLSVGEYSTKLADNSKMSRLLAKDSLKKAAWIIPVGEVLL
jgi:hypothetical protein